MTTNDLDELQTMQYELLQSKQEIANLETKCEVGAEIVTHVAQAVQQLSLTSLLILKQYIDKALNLVGVAFDE